MSHNEERRKLKPRRFNKFEQSLQPPADSRLVNAENVPKKVQKRPNTELPDYSNHKKPCYGLMHPPSTTVNLANNRLKKLKQNLIADVKNTNSPLSNSSAPKPNKDPKLNTDSSLGQEKNLETLRSPKRNIYDNLNKWTSPPEGLSGNDANNRLKRLKNFIKEGNTSNNLVSDSTATNSKEDKLNKDSNWGYKNKLSKYGSPTVSKINISDNLHKLESPPEASWNNDANERMKRHKKVIIENSNNITSNSMSGSPAPKLNEDRLKLHTDGYWEPKKNLESHKVSTKVNIYDNLQEWGSSSNNNANQRFKRIKEVMIKNTGSPKFSDSSGITNNSRLLTPNSPSQHRSNKSPPTPYTLMQSPNTLKHINDNRHTSPLLRDDTSKQFENSLFSLNSTASTKNTNKSVDNTINLNKISTINDSILVKQGHNVDYITSCNNSSGLSSRILKIKKNTDQLNSTIMNNAESSLHKSEDSRKNSILKEKSNSSYISNDETPTYSNILNKCSNSITPVSKRLKLKRTLPSSINSDSNLSSNISIINEKRNLNDSPISHHLKLKRSYTPSINDKSIHTKSTQNIPIIDTNNIIINTDLNNTKILNLKRKNNTPIEPNNDSKMFNTFTFKEPSTPILRRESLSSLNIPIPSDLDKGDTDDTFTDKMAMTANWIRSHQQFGNNFVTTGLSPIGVKNNNCSHNISSCNSEMEKGNNLETSEEMEWTNAEPDDVLEIGKNSENKTLPFNTQEIQNVPVPALHKPDIVEKIEKDKNLCIIVDTNIFISELSKLTDIITMKISGSIQPLLYIPWMVITELDEIKDRSGDSKLKQKAFNAVKFINRTLSEENPRVKGQTVADMGHQNHVGASPDDKIIGCCLQALEKYESVILLSNDINLKNKAMINNISASSSNEIIMKIMSKLLKTTKTQKISQKVGILCSEIICASAKEAYGDVWTKMDMLSNPPWPLIECLKRFKKYWIAVFQEKVMKHFLPAVDKLLHLMTNNKGICDDTEVYVQFVKLNLNMCIFLKDIEEYRGSIENTINDITKIG